MGGLVCRNNSAGPSVAQPGVHNSTFIPKFPVGKGREEGRRPPARGREAALFGAAPATKGQLKGRRTVRGGPGQPRPGRVTHTLLSSVSWEFWGGGCFREFPWLCIKPELSASALHPGVLRIPGSALGQKKSYGAAMGALSPDPNAGQLRGLTEQQGAHRVSRKWTWGPSRLIGEPER